MNYQLRFVLICFVFSLSIFRSHATDTLNIPGAHIGYAIIDINTGKMIQSLNENDFFTPASTLKCITGAISLRKLGHDYHFYTKIVATGKLSHGTLDGNILINGSGDPSLDQNICQTIKNLGIDSIKGRLIINGSEPYISPTIMLEDIGTEYGVGWSNFNYNNNRALVNDCMMMFPLQYIIDDLKFDLWNNGIILEDGFLDIDSMSMMVEHRSDALTELVTYMLHESDNLYAQSIGRELSPQKKIEDSIDSISAYIQSIGLSTSNFKIVDHCGLSRMNLLTPALLANFLKNESQNQKFVECLPKVGKQGTVERLLKHTRLEEKLVLKSGSMTGILAYAGYKLGNDNKPSHAIVIFINDANCQLSSIRKKIEQWLLEIF